MPSFNLVREPWLPCLAADGSEVELGLLETLTRAHELRELHDASPLVTAALHRLLLAVLHRCFGPASRGEWSALWAARAFDDVVLHDYFAKWEDRFDLFSDTYPFWQTASLAEGRPWPIVRLNPALAAKNNKTLFDHSLDEVPMPVQPATAARWLVAFQVFDPAGLAGGGRPNFTDAPAARGVQCLGIGSSLFETLMLNAVVYRPQGHPPMPEGFSADDAPTWESDTALHGVGYLRFLTWPSRRIRLLVTPEGAADSVLVRQGEEVPAQLTTSDPLAAYRTGKKEGIVRMTLQPGKAVWRDSHALLASLLGYESLAPRQRMLAALVDDNRVERHQVAGCDVLGWAPQKAGQASMLLWRHARLPVPAGYLEEQGETFIDKLGAALQQAEDAAKAVSAGLWVFARNALKPNNPEKADKRDVQSLIDDISAEEDYWAELERPFLSLLERLPVAAQEARAEWSTAVRDAAVSSFERAIDALPRTAHNLRAGVAATPVFRGRLKKLMEVSGIGG
jgi:CRISPR system Cascade subunit CasA